MLADCRVAAPKASCFCCRAHPEPRRWPRITSGRRSTGRAGKVPSPGNCPPPRASPGCCAIRAVPLMPWPSSSRSTTGSPRASIRPTSKRHAQIDQAQLGVDEVEVVMQAFASIRPQEGAMRVLVMPGLVGVAGFHRRDDMHQAGTVATDDKHPGDDVLLADVVLGNVFDGNASGTRQLGGALAHLIAKRFGKSRIVEDPDLPGRKKSRHSLRVTGSRQRAGDDDPVIAGEHPGEALAVTLRQRLPQPPLLLPASPASILACLVPATPAWGRSLTLRLASANGRNRRNSVIAARFGQGPLTNPQPALA